MKRFGYVRGVPGFRYEPTRLKHPAKLLRITSMVRGLLEEVRQSSLDASGRARMRDIYERSREELKGTLSAGLQQELDTLASPLEGTPTESEIRVAQAQLMGWLEGLLHGIQAALWAQEASRNGHAALEPIPSESRGQAPEATGPVLDPRPGGNYL